MYYYIFLGKKYLIIRVDEWGGGYFFLGPLQEGTFTKLNIIWLRRYELVRERERETE